MRQGDFDRIKGRLEHHKKILRALESTLNITIVQ